MKNYEIVFLEQNKAVFRVCDMPEINDNEMLVGIEVSSISSGTERANLSGEINVSISDNNSQAVFPRYSGYSSSGVVVKIGKNIKSVQAGDRVALSWSTHRRFIKMTEQNIIKIESDKVDFAQAALAHIATFPLAAIRKCRAEIGESAIVIGMGVLGLIAVQLLSLSGVYPVIAADPVPSRRKKALEIGADFALDPFEKNFTEQVKEITGGGANIAIEVTGNGGALNQVLDCMKRFGRVALLGCTRNSDFSIDYYHKVHGPGISLIGAHTNARPSFESSPAMWTVRDDIAALLKIIHGGKLDLNIVIEQTYSPADAEKVYNRLLTDSYFPVTQFDWSLIK